MSIPAGKPPSYHLHASHEKSVHRSFTKASSPLPRFYARFTFIGSCWQRIKLGPKHKEHLAWLEGRGYGNWDETAWGINTHTSHVEEMCEHFDLPGDFETSATGKEGAKGRNCILYPKKRGLWLCARYGNVTENGPGWTINAKGHATCMVGKAASMPKIDHADTIVHDALETDNFFHWEGGGIR